LTQQSFIGGASGTLFLLAPGPTPETFPLGDVGSALVRLTPPTITPEPSSFILWAILIVGAAAWWWYLRRRAALA